MKANRDSSITIKEIDRYCIHIKLTKVSVNDKDPINTRQEQSIIQIFSVKEFESMQKRHADPDEWLKIAGFAKGVVVHDGRLEPLEEEVVNEAVQAVDEKIAAEVKKAVKKERAKRNVIASGNKAK